MISFIIFLVVAIVTALLGGLLVKFTIDEVRGKEWALNIIIGLFSLLIAFLSINLSINYLIGFVIAIIALLIATRFSNLGFIDFAIIYGVMLSLGSIYIKILLAILIIPLGTLIALKTKKNWFKNILLIDLALSISALTAYYMLNYYNNSLIMGMLGGLMTFYGINFAKKGRKTRRT